MPLYLLQQSADRNLHWFDPWCRNSARWHRGTFVWHWCLLMNCSLIFCSRPLAVLIYDWLPFVGSDSRVHCIGTVVISHYLWWTFRLLAAFLVFVVAVDCIWRYWQCCKHVLLPVVWYPVSCGFQFKQYNHNQFNGPLSRMTGVSHYQKKKTFICGRNITLLYLWKAVLPSVLWRCWLGGRKVIWPVKNRVVGCWHDYLSGVRCIVAYGPADATATHCLLLQ